MTLMDHVQVWADPLGAEAVVLADFLALRQQAVRGLAFSVSGGAVGCCAEELGGGAAVSGVSWGWRWG